MRKPKNQTQLLSFMTDDSVFVKPDAWTQSELERKALVEQGVSVVANLRKDHRLIAWAISKNKFAKIDRGTKWGNPFVMKLERDRDSVYGQFAEHFEQSALRTQIAELRGMVLGCWCNPKRCHGDYLAKKANGGSE